MKESNIWIASKPGRGSGLKYPAKEGYIRIDVTSGSKKLIGKFPATQLSPLYLGPVEDCDGEEANRFETLWQYRKVYPQLKHWDKNKEEPTKTWKTWKSKGYIKLKGNKGIRTPPEISKLKKKFREEGIPWTPIGLWWDGELLSYIEARKKVYVPVYANLVKQTDAFKALKKLLKGGSKILILDLDGPPIDKYPQGIPVNEENIVKMLNNPKYPFGHGYVIAALLAGIDIFEK